MTAFIWLLTWLLPLLSAMSELQQPVNLTLTSAHFNTILKWKPGSGMSSGVSYKVSFNIDTGTSWTAVPNCQLIQQPLVCDLTEVFSDPNKTYLAQVITLLGTQESQPAISTGFRLIRDSQLDLPLLTVTQCGTNLCVELQFPKLYKLNMSQYHQDMYNSSLKYKLNIKINGADVQMQECEIHYLQKHIVMPVFPGKSYCVSVCFWNKLIPKVSNCSKHECADIPGLFSTDLWISTVPCVLVLVPVVIVAFLFCTGFIGLSKKPLPPVLTSVPHRENVLINAASSLTLSSIQTVKAALPSSGKRRHKQSSSDESDGESESTEGDYNLRVGTNLLSSSSSSSSSCLSNPVGPAPEAQPLLSSNQTSYSSETLSTSTQSHTLSTHRDRGTVGAANPQEEEKEEEERKVAEEEGSQDVNLLTLTFGRHEAEKEEEQESHMDVAEAVQETPSVSEEEGITSVQPSQPRDISDTAIETALCSVDEEDDEEDDDSSGYMGRPCTAVFHKLL